MIRPMVIEGAELLFGRKMVKPVEQAPVHLPKPTLHPLDIVHPIHFRGSAPFLEVVGPQAREYGERIPCQDKSVEGMRMVPYPLLDQQGVPFLEFQMTCPRVPYTDRPGSACHEVLEQGDLLR